MDRQVQRVGTLFLLWFGILALGAGYWQIWRGPALSLAAGNPRLIEAELRAQRGAIVDRRDRVIVESVQGRRTVRRPHLVHTTGYYSLRYGRTGVEQAFDGVLSGREGWPVAQAWARGLLGLPRAGGSVQLTVDSELQDTAARALGDVRGAVVVLDVRTGASLALLSQPGFDAGRVDEDWPRLSTDEARPLYNRTSQGLYVPGSTFKVVTAVAALDAGVIQPSTLVSDPTGEVVVDGFRITDAERPPRPTFDFAHGFAWSSNVVFAQLGLQVGEARLLDYAGRFGMGRPLPFELETSPTSVARTRPMPPALLASTAFGQGELLMSPLQMAVVAASVARDGDVPRPFVVAEVRSPTGALLRRTRPESLGRAMTPGTARAMREMMALAVEDGFSRNAALAGVRVGGKTGTAQSVPGQPDHSWFIGIAPIEQPRVAIAVLMEFSGWGSLEAAPVARHVLEHALRLTAG
jgi:peptidoglycan glycosyltransferase